MLRINLLSKLKSVMNYHTLHKNRIVFDTMVIKNKSSFTLNQKYLVEKSEMSVVRARVGNEQFYDLLMNSYDQYSFNKERNFKNLVNNNLINEMQKGTSVIYRPFYYHPYIEQSKLVPTLLVRSDYFNSIFNGSLPKNLEYLKARRFCEEYHYISVDFRNEDLQITSGKLPETDDNIAYECKLNVYNNVIGDLQGCIPTMSYVIDSTGKMAEINFRYFHEEYFIELISYCNLSKAFDEKMSIE